MYIHGIGVVFVSNLAKVIMPWANVEAEMINGACRVLSSAWFVQSRMSQQKK
jgi:hypothetical protein